MLIFKIFSLFCLKQLNWTWCLGVKNSIKRHCHRFILLQTLPRRVAIKNSVRVQRKSQTNRFPTPASSQQLLYYATHCVASVKHVTRKGEQAPQTQTKPKTVVICIWKTFFRLLARLPAIIFRKTVCIEFEVSFVPKQPKKRVVVNFKAVVGSSDDAGATTWTSRVLELRRHRRIAPDLRNNFPTRINNF